jgi:hypothetical protein
VSFAPTQRLFGRFKLLGHGVRFIAINYERIQMNRRAVL